ncbi:MAG: non-heme iron oxygenase ferredoxin subunit [Planctomycetes bacterium]|nr:non-heme iron oxygenase ferredoxin subunit [Planctomycetota bacterium]
MAEFVKAVRTAELVPGKGTVVELNGVRIAIFNVDGAFYAMNDTCTHASGPLSEGDLDGTVVTCPWHGATFDIKTGAVLGPPAADGVRSYEVKTEGDDVLVKVG